MNIAAANQALNWQIPFLLWDKKAKKRRSHDGIARTMRLLARADQFARAAAEQYHPLPDDFPPVAYYDPYDMSDPYDRPYPG